MGGSAPAIAAEAFTRAAWLKTQLGSYKDALELIDRAGATDDEAVTYWRHLFRGRVLTGLNRDADAESEYRAALDARASAHSASVGLALTLFKQRRLDEARALAASIRQAPPDVVDPWWTYLAADARFVTKWMEDVRREDQAPGARPQVLENQEAPDVGAELPDLGMGPALVGARPPSRTVTYIALDEPG